MKYFTIIALFMLSSALCLSQEQELKLKELQAKKNSIEKEMGTLQESLNIISQEIVKIESEINQKKFTADGDNFMLMTSLRMDGKLRIEPSPIAEIITIIEEGQNVNLTDNKDGYWIVNKGKYFGYLSELYIEETEEVAEFKKMLKTRRREYAKKKEQEVKKKKEQDQKKYRQSIIDLYGATIANRLFNGEIWLGMDRTMLIVSKGYPISINKSVGIWGIHEQFVYGNSYYYIENDKLTSYQK